MEYAELVQCLSSIALIFLTAILAVETRLLRKAETDPNVILYLRPNDKAYALIELVLENAGNGAARNVLVELDKDLQMSNGRYLSMIGFLNGVSVLAPGQKLVSYVDSVLDPDDVPDKRTEGTVSYVTDNGKLCTQRFFINFDELLGVESSYSQEFSMAHSLERIAAAIGKDPEDLDVA